MNGREKTPDETGPLTASGLSDGSVPADADFGDVDDTEHPPEDDRE